MLSALKFVQGAVAKKDFVPALTHFRIKDHKVMGFNGNLAIGSPIPCDLDISPNAAQLTRALQACEETISLHMNRKGKLVVQSGNFQTLVDCDDPVNFPQINLEGNMVFLDDGLLPALKLMEPFISTDNSRPWACGALFNGDSIYATNNIILIQYWLGYLFPCRVNLPAGAVRELVRIGVSPDRLQITDSRLIFHYPDKRWLATQLLESNWPVNIEAALAQRDFHALHPIPDGLWTSLEQLAPFADDIGRCYLHGNHVATMPEAEIAGAAVAQDCWPGGIYNINQLLNLKDIVTGFGWNHYPASVPFAGKRCRGIIAGIID